jgi:hypothetical protein
VAYPFPQFNVTQKTGEPCESSFNTTMLYSVRYENGSIPEYVQFLNITQSAISILPNKIKGSYKLTVLGMLPVGLGIVV